MTEKPCAIPPADGCKYSEESAKSAVKQVFAILGVDVDDPKEVEDFRRDLRFGGMMRKAGDKGFIAVVMVAFTALALAAWTGIASKIPTIHQ